MGTHVLTSRAPSSPCGWWDFATASIYVCDLAVVKGYVVVTFSDDGTNTVVDIVVEYNIGGIGVDPVQLLYSKTFSGRVACDAFTDEPIPYVSDTCPDGWTPCDYGITIDDALLTTS